MFDEQLFDEGVLLLQLSLESVHLDSDMSQFSVVFIEDFLVEDEFLCEASVLQLFFSEETLGKFQALLEFV